MLLATLAASQGHAQRGGEPGRFDYYVLVLGWTPSYCATEGKKRRDRQCAVGFRSALGSESFACHLV